jgi:hypothetical protein
MNSRSIILTGLAAITLMGVMAFGHTALADDLMQVNMTGTVTLKSTSKSAIREGRPAALHDAAKKLWRFMQTNPAFQENTRNFSNEQNDQMVAFLESECTISDLDQEVNSTTYLLSWRFRFDCATQKVNSQISQLNAKMSSSSGSASQDSTPIVFLFFEQRNSEKTNFDETVNKVNQRGTQNSSSDKATATLNVDNKVHGAVKTSQSEQDKFGEGRGSANESVDKSASVKGRLTIDNSATATLNRDTNNVTTQSSTTSGSTTRKEAEVKSKITQAVDFGIQFNEFFSHYKKFTPFDYADVRECSSSAPKREEVLATLQPGEQLQLDSDVQRRVFAAIRECGIRWVIIARIKVELPSVDPASGGYYNTVDVSADLRDLNKKPLPARYSAAAPSVKGQGTQDTATNAAMRNAARQLGEKVLNIISEQGVQ